MNASSRTQGMQQNTAPNSSKRTSIILQKHSKEKQVQL